MTDKDLYSTIEKFDEYPSEYKKNIKTQRKLIEDTVVSSENKQRKTIYRLWQIASVFMIAIVTVYLFISSKNHTKTIAQLKQLPQIKTANDSKPNNSNRKFAVSNYQKKSHVTISKLDTSQSFMDTVKTTNSATLAILNSTDTIVSNKSVATIEKPRIFSKKQRFKQFEFEAKTNSQIAKSKSSKMEFFVIKDGKLSIFPKKFQTTNEK